jgi:hypothetical protein
MFKLRIKVKDSFECDITLELSKLIVLVQALNLFLN